MTATVKYKVATYSGKVVVNCAEHDQDEHIIAKAKMIVRRQAGGYLPYGYQSWKVISRNQ